MNILLLGYGKSNKFLKRHFKNDNVVVITDDDYQKLLNSNIVFDFAFCSPGVRPDSLIYRLGKICSITFTNELSYAINLLPQKTKIIAVTGSNGKTTTVSEIAYFLRKNNRSTVLCGNVGNPLINLIDAKKQVDFVVIEISSFQAELINIKRKFDCLIYTSLTENHSDKYLSYDEYKLAKKRLSYFANNVLVTPDVNRQLKIENANIIKEADKELIEKYGLHNAINFALTQKCLNLFSFNMNKEQLYNFVFPKYRQEIIFKSEDLIIINDSKSTTGESTNACLKRFSDYFEIAILGGKIKSNFKIVKNKKTIFIAYGKDSGNFSKLCQIDYCFKRLKEAIDKSFELLKYIKGKKALLFSPGGSSLEFKNYVERGRYFELMVNNHE